MNEICARPDKATHLIEYTPDAVANWHQRGIELCQKIYRKQFTPLMKRVSTFAPELKDSMIVEGYGKVLSRAGLHIIYRELCVVSMLTLKFRPRQLYSHIVGALRVGADADQLEIAMSAASKFNSKEKSAKCEAILSESVARYIMP